MRIKKYVQGKWIDLELVKIKKYPRYTRYQVYKVVDNELIPVYTECYSDYQFRELMRNKYIVNEEVDLCLW
jgi:hypothetical protein